ncbi:hypothetical protein Pint_33539 [Pistacia integerrima]|uniref:Uncharacterized protein n=1 Tax=Pistacia integerrima TaxID=434235 RepID=A0ACC0X2N2_9ROSI|nr:hypothetical protein Pint_33539 [Pistacia integerrima]
MSASPNSSTSNVAETNLPTFNPSSSINPTKLTCLNFPTWKATMLPYLKGQRVYGYIDGTIQQPAKPSLPLMALPPLTPHMIFGKPRIILFLAA